MPNTNCLEGFKCPKCGAEKEFRIEVSTVVTFTDEGSSDEGADKEWQDDSYCECTACDHAGKVRDFRKPELPLETALRTLMDKCDAVESAISGVTGQFEPEIAEMSRAVTQAEKLLIKLTGKGTR